MTVGESDVDRLAKDYWEKRMANEPVFATALGDRRYDDRLPDITPEGRKRVVGQYTELVRKAEGTTVDGESEKLVRTALIVDLNSVIDYISCGLDDWTVDPQRGPQINLMNVDSIQPVEPPE